MKYKDSTDRSMAEIVNQRSLNVLFRMFERIPPVHPQVKRREIKKVMREVVRGPVQYDENWVTGRTLKKRRKPLIRANLILNKYFGRKGQPGLYGEEMKKYSSRFIARAQKSVGYLKAVLIPAMKRLNAVCRFKRPWWGRHVAIWPNSAASSHQILARPKSPTFSLHISAPTVKDRGHAQVLMETAFVKSMSDEADEMIAHVSRKLSEQARKQGMKVSGRL